MKRILAALCMLAVLFNLSTAVAAKISSFSPDEVVLATAVMYDFSVIDSAELEEKGEERLTIFALLPSGLSFTSLMLHHLSAAPYSDFPKTLLSRQIPAWLRLSNLRL